MKTSVSLRAPRLVALLALAFATLSASNLSAQTVITNPVGAVTLSIKPGTGVARALTTLSFPLLDTAVIAGKTIGQISSVTANSISDSSARWTAGQISTPSVPCLIQITSGAAAGRIFAVSTTTANTATTVTVDSEEATVVNLTTLSIAPGDSYKILAADTLNSLFGSSLLTNTSSALADNVAVLSIASGTYSTYWHNGTNWRRVGPGSTNFNNLVIRPDSIVTVNRLSASAYSLTVTGDVPSLGRKAIVRNGGLSSLATGWPSGNVTLSSSGINSLPGWVSNTNSTIADNVVLLDSATGTNSTYWHNGTNWRRVGPGSASFNATVIPVGSGVTINKKGSATGTTALAQTAPYTL